MARLRRNAHKNVPGGPYRIEGFRLPEQGMAGGELVVTPVEKTEFIPEDAAIVGKMCLYGATGGQIFVRDKSGEHFAVRNSLVQAVVEGTRDYYCEYMTDVGKHVTAGMAGGLDYVLDEDDTLIPKVRGMMEQPGYERLDDIIGCTVLLRPRNISLVKTHHLVLRYIFFKNVGLPKVSSTKIRKQDAHSNGHVLDDILLSDAEWKENDLLQDSSRTESDGILRLCGDMVVLPRENVS
ncbi:hypothetical protein AgCh_037320 [Apium graveolens]